MERGRILALASGMAALLAASAFAQGAQPHHRTSRAGMVHSIREAYAEVTPRSLPHAIGVVERATGGKVLEIRMMHEHGPGFAAVVARGGELINVRVSSHDDVTRVRVNEAPRWMLGWRLRTDMKDIDKVRISPQDAVRMAEQSTQGTAVDAGLARPISATNRVLAYNIEVVQAGQPRRVAVDARTGEMIADPRQVLAPWTPERLAQQEMPRRG